MFSSVATDFGSWTIKFLSGYLNTLLCFFIINSDMDGWMDGWTDGWMDDLRLYVIFNSVSVISGRWVGDNER